jgi:NAD(P)-dependent dehydrogenase (short-subunit alcohol dehydrogenase family)
MTFDFSGKVAVVTGASRGIGLSVARGFAAAGADIIILAEDPAVIAAGDGLGIEFGGAVHPIVCDVTDRRGMARVLGAAPRIDILVSNAGTGDITPIDDASDEVAASFDRIIQINLIGAYNTVRAALPRMQTGGRIIFTSSVHGQGIAPPGMSAYAASKGGLDAMIHSLARELGPRGISVNGVAPGMVATELTLGAIRKLFAAQIGAEGSLSQEDMIRQLNAPQAIHFTPVDPDRLAQSYLFLASAAGAEITGQILNVDHGLSMK